MIALSTASAVPEQIRTDRLVAALSEIPQEFTLTLTYRKTPIRPGWNKENLSRAELARLLKHGDWMEHGDRRYKQEYDGLALIIPSGYVVADIDGITAQRLRAEISGRQSHKTVAWSSGKPNRGSLLYRLPDTLIARIETLPERLSKIKLTECPTWKTQGSDAIELLLSGSRATIPPSAHPETPGYEFKLGWDYGIQAAPAWVVQAIEVEVAKREYWATQPKQQFTGTVEQQDVEQWLSAVHPDTLDYDSWVKVGMAVKSAFPDDRGLELWDEWSQAGASYKPRDCDKRWDGFTADRVPIAYLARLAGFELRAIGADFAKSDPERTDKQRERDRLISKRRMGFNQTRELWVQSWKLTETFDRPIIQYDGSAVDLGIDLTLAKTIGIRGGLASGKTEALIRAIVAEAIRRGDAGLAKGKNALQIVVLCPTNGLCRQFEDRLIKALQKAGINLPVLHFQVDVTLAREALRDGYAGVYVMCKETFSDYHVGDVDWSPVIVAIDEFSTFRQTLPKSPQAPQLIRMLEDCGNLFAADRYFSDADDKFLASYRYRGGDRLLLAQNEVKEKKIIHFIECLTKDGLISLSQSGVALTLLRRWQKQGLPLKRVAIGSDNLLELKIIARWIAANGGDLKHLLICSETVEDTHRFMPNPDEEIQNAQIYYLVYSPTAQSGVDIQTPFDRGILICTGVLSPTLMIQMLGRCRQCFEWWVSAPRRSLDSAMIVKCLDDDKLKRRQYKVEQAFTRLGVAKSDRRINATSIYNQTIREFERQFNTECIFDLLQDGYETIDVVEVETSRQEYDALLDAVRNEDAKKLLNADLANGTKLLQAKRAPSTDAEVQDVKLAELHSKYPQHCSKLLREYAEWKSDKAPTAAQAIAEIGGIEAVRQTISELLDNELNLVELLAKAEEEADVARRIHAPERLVTANRDRQDIGELLATCRAELDKLRVLVIESELGGNRTFIEQMRLLTSSRIERLYEGERARQNNAQDLINLKHSFERSFTSVESKRYQEYRRRLLFNRLDFEALAQAKHGDKWKTNGLWARGNQGSDELLSRFELFQQDEELIELFPEIESAESLFAAVKSVLNAYNYKSSGGNVRQEIEGRHKNGSDRRGEQRFTRTRSIYCVVFLRLECSGSKLFQQLLPELLEDIRDRIERERKLFKPKEAAAGVHRSDRPPNIPKAA